MIWFSAMNSKLLFVIILSFILSYVKSEKDKTLDINVNWGKNHEFHHDNRHKSLQSHKDHNGATKEWSLVIDKIEPESNENESEESNNPHRRHKQHKQNNDISKEDEREDKSNENKAKGNTILNERQDKNSTNHHRKKPSSNIITRFQHLLNSLQRTIKNTSLYITDATWEPAEKLYNYLLIILIRSKEYFDESVDLVVGGIIRFVVKLGRFRLKAIECLQTRNINIIKSNTKTVIKCLSWKNEEGVRAVISATNILQDFLGIIKYSLTGPCYCHSLECIITIPADIIKKIVALIFHSIVTDFQLIFYGIIAIPAIPVCTAGISILNIPRLLIKSGYEVGHCIA